MQVRICREPIFRTPMDVRGRPWTAPAAGATMLRELGYFTELPDQPTERIPQYLPRFELAAYGRYKTVERV